MNKCALRHTRPRSVGFTLVELMVTIAILAIVLAIGVPSFQSFLHRQQVMADASTLSSAFRLARSEAMKRSGVVTVCPSANPTETPPSCVAAATTNWTTGWLIFVDYPDSSGATGVYESGSDTLIRIEQGIQSGSITASASRRSVSFQANGIATGAANSFTINPAMASDSSGFRELQRCLNLSFQGRTRLEAGPCVQPSP